MEVVCDGIGNYCIVSMEKHFWAGPNQRWIPTYEDGSQLLPHPFHTANPCIHGRGDVR